LQIEYETKAVEKLLIDINKLYKVMGIELQKKLKATLNRLEAAENFNEFLALGLGKPHSLRGGLKGYYGIILNGNARLVVKPEGDFLDSNIFVVKGVCDYHGEKIEWIIP